MPAKHGDSQHICMNYRKHTYTYSELSIFSPFRLSLTGSALPPLAVKGCAPVRLLAFHFISTQFLCCCKMAFIYLYSCCICMYARTTS